MKIMLVQFHKITVYSSYVVKITVYSSYVVNEGSMGTPPILIIV